MPTDFNFIFDRCVFFDAKPGHTSVDTGIFTKDNPEAMVVALTKLEDDALIKNNELHPSVGIYIYSEEQALAYANIFNQIAEDLSNKKED